MQQLAALYVLYIYLLSQPITTHLNNFSVLKNNIHLHHTIHMTLHLQYAPQLSSLSQTHFAQQVSLAPQVYY